MNHSEVTETETNSGSETIAFGEPLRKAREAQSLTVEEVSVATHLTEAIINAIEASDIARLPPPTFVQGYLRIYARYMELDDAKIVADFNRTIPHKRETELQPRSNLPSQASSHSPLIRGVSFMLLGLVVVALVYGAYDYYTKTAESMVQEKVDNDSMALDLPDNSTDEVVQHAVITEDGELIVVAPEGAQDYSPDAEQEAAIDDTQPDPERFAADTETEAEAAPANASSESTQSTEPVAGQDVLNLRAGNDSWVEIVDAGNNKLYHNLLQKDQSLELKGEAPFDVFLGNAPAVKLTLNGIDVNMKRYIRTNNVARFSVSTRNESVVFH